MVACSGCGKALAESDVLYTSDARAVCDNCFGQADVRDIQTRASSLELGLAGVGLAIGVAPFAASVTTLSNVGGHVTYRDWVAIPGGAIAAGFGAAALVMTLRGRRKLGMLALAIGVVALGAYQLARGFGVFAS
jgi:hypothetical protein